MSVPEYPVAGVYVYVPSALTTTVPCVGCVVPSVKVLASPAMVVASAATVPVIGLFSTPDLLSGLAVMASGVTVSVTVAVDVAPEWSVTT